jgi:hypothetical protein
MTAGLFDSSEGILHGEGLPGRERLRAVQKRLVAAGVSDVKFTPRGGWSVFLHEMPDTEVERDALVDKIAGDLAKLLESYLAGRCVTLFDSRCRPSGFPNMCGDAP